MPTSADVAVRAIEWAQSQDYVGYAKGDALNSPLVRRLAGESRVLRSGANYLVERSPFGLRPWLGVRRHPSPKAHALFLRASLLLGRLTRDPVHLARAHDLAERLEALSQIERASGHCWGPEYPRSNPTLGASLYAPGAVVTAEVAEAFVDLALDTGEDRYAEVARSAARFIERDLRMLERGPGGVCFSYVPDHDWKVVNANAKTACALARVAALTDDPARRELAADNMRWVIGRQTAEGAWFYADPPDSSHVKHDGYHTGFVVSSLGEALDALGDETLLDPWRRGLAFYRDHLFLADGAPKWRSNRVYPMDVKGAALGVVAFAQAAQRIPDHLPDAERIAQWTLDHLWHPNGRFDYQQGRLLAKRITLMRWCQGWSCFAFASLADAQARSNA